MKFLFAAIMFMIGTDTFIVSPLLPTLRHEFGIGADTSGWLMSAYALGYALTAIVAGPLTERMNRKNVLIAGLTGFAAATALCGTSFGFESMFLFRLLAGIFAAIASPQIWASIPQMTAPSQVLRTLGFAAAGLSLAQVLGIPLGSLLAQTSWRWPFFAVGMLTLPVILCTMKYFPAVRPADPSMKRLSIFRSYRSLLSRRESRYGFTAHLIFFIGVLGSFTYIGNWMADQFQLNLAQIGWLMLVNGLGNLAGSIWGGRLTERWGRRRTMTIVFSAIGIVFAAAPFFPNIWEISLLLLISSFAGGQSFPLLVNTLQSIDARMRGTISSLANSIMYLGATVGAALAGRLYVGFNGFGAVGAMVLICMVFTLALFYRSRLLKPASGKISA